jgi:hypothetical protein
VKSLGQIAYEAYCASTNGVSPITGDVLPLWTDLLPPRVIKDAWEAAAEAVAQTVRGEPV